jgi:hypothetical protein
MKSKIAALVAGAMMLAGSLPLGAHHSFDAEYDRTKSRNFEGKVTKVEWMNPHARFYMDVKEADGKVVNWEFELGSPNGLMRNGWTRNSIKIGDVIKCAGNLAKDGSALANARNLTLANGTVVGAASSGDNGKQ